MKPSDRFVCGEIGHLIETCKKVRDAVKKEMLDLGTKVLYKQLKVIEKGKPNKSRQENVLAAATKGASATADDTYDNEAEELEYKPKAGLSKLYKMHKMRTDLLSLMSLSMIWPT